MKRTVLEIKTESHPHLREKNCIFPRVLDGYWVEGGVWTVDSGRHLDVNYSLWPYNPFVSRQKEGVVWLVINGLLRISAHLPSLLFPLSCHPLADEVKDFSLQNPSKLFAVSLKIAQFVFHTGSSEEFILSNRGVFCFY